MNVHGTLDQLSQQIAAYEATKGTAVVMAGDAGAPTLELRSCVEHLIAQLHTVGAAIVENDSLYRYAPLCQSLLSRCELLIAQRYKQPEAFSESVANLKARLTATVTPAPSPDRV